MRATASALAAGAAAAFCLALARRRRQRGAGASVCGDDELALLVRGTVIASASRAELAVHEHAVLGVTGAGQVAFLEAGHTESLAAGGALRLRGDGSGGVAEVRRLPSGLRIVELPKRGFLVPGFVDTHTHAPQYFFTGKGYDLQLLDWLNTYTFPAEAKFSREAHAAAVCSNAVRRTLQHGTTSCVYFCSLHTDAALALGRACAAQGQRALVGKVNMDRNAPDYYVEGSAATSLSETERLLRELPTVAPPSLVQPILTPRFVPTCTSELMSGLGALAKARGLRVQTHVSENKGEIAWVRELHPEQPSYAAVYDAAGLLREGTILAHGIHLDAAERALVRERGAVVSHCPMSNNMLSSGCLNVRRMLDEGVRVALGTDVSGGASPSMLTAIREALKVSNLVAIGAGGGGGDEPGEAGAAAGGGGGPRWPALKFAEAFWLATVGGAQALAWPGVTGDFGVGSTFDAVAVDPEAAGSGVDLYDDDGSLDAFQKWLQLGDDRNTAAVWVGGRQVLPRTDLHCRPCCAAA